MKQVHLKLLLCLLLLANSVTGQYTGSQLGQNIGAQPLVVGQEPTAYGQPALPPQAPTNFGQYAAAQPTLHCHDEADVPQGPAGYSVSVAAPIVKSAQSSYGSSDNFAASAPVTIVKSASSSYGSSDSFAASAPVTILKSAGSSYGSSSNFAAPTTFVKSAGSSYGSNSNFAAPTTFVKSAGSSYGSNSNFAAPTTFVKSAGSSYGSNSNFAAPTTFVKSAGSSYGSSDSFAASAPVTILKSAGSSYGSSSNFAAPTTFVKSAGSSYGSGDSFAASAPVTILKSAGSSYGSNNNFAAPATFVRSAQSSYGNSNNFAAPPVTTLIQSTVSSYGNRGSFATPVVSSFIKSAGSSIGALPVGQPYGIQSTGQYVAFSDEPVDVSVCGSVPADNPCTPYGQQYFPIPNAAQCFIQCSFARSFVRVCPTGLVWNSLINACDWPTVAQPPASDTGFGSSSYGVSNDNTVSAPSYSYGRKKRSATERKKRFLPGFGKPIVTEVPLGPPIPGLIPLPGFPGPIGIPGPLIPPPLIPPFLPPMIPPFGPIPPPLLPPPLLPPFPLVPPFLPPFMPPMPLPLGGPLLPPLPMSLPATFIPGPPPIFGPPFLPPFGGPFGPLGGPLGGFGGPLGGFGGPLGGLGGPFGGLGGPLGGFGLEPFGPEFEFGGGFPFGEGFFGGSPDPFFEPGRFSGGHDNYGGYGGKGKYNKGGYGNNNYGNNNYGDSYSNDYNNDDYGYSKKSYGNSYSNDYNNDDYGYSKKSYGNSYSNDYNNNDNRNYKKNNYKKNGNFKPKSKYNNNDYSSYDNGYDNSYDNGYDYRKKRDYGLNVEQQQPRLLSYRPMSFSYGSLPSGLISQQSRVLPTQIQTQQPVIPQQTIQPTLCAGKPNNTNIPYPSDATKYISCLSEEHFEIMDCPSGLIYNAEHDKCEKVKDTEQICAREQPCLNDGQCHQTSPTTYKCQCREGWTGEKCEVPLSSCASNPCGEGNECHTLVTKDYKQDFVCICNGKQSYGLSCDKNTVPNPCATAADTNEQYYPFAFSAQAYVQCNGDLLYVRPCPGGLYWNQEDKICDREPTAPVRTIANQPESYQIDTNTKSVPLSTGNTYGQIVDRQQGSRYRNYSPQQTFVGQESSFHQMNVPQKPQTATSYGSPVFSVHQNRRFPIQQTDVSNQQYGQSVTEQKQFPSVRPFARSSLFRTVPSKPIWTGNNVNTQVQSTSYRR